MENETKTLSGRFLLGTTVGSYLAFVEFELVHRPGDNPTRRFTASFDCVSPFDVSRIDEDYCYEYLKDFSDSDKYSFCEKFDCAPSELASRFQEETTVEDIIDCISYLPHITVNGTEYVFECMSCGQTDLLYEMKTFTNEEAFRTLYLLWRLYHLKNLDNHEFQLVLEGLTKVIAAFNEVDEEAFIKEFLEHIDD